MNIISRINNSVSFGAKLVFAMIAGAAIQAMATLSLVGFDDAIADVDAARKKATTPAIRVLARENKALTKKLVKMGGPCIKIGSYIPENENASGSARIEQYVHRNNTLVVNFSEKAAKAYEAGDKDILAQVDEVLHSENIRKVLAHPYPALEP